MNWRSTRASPQEWVRMLRLMETHPTAAVERAVTAAVERHSPRLETVRLILRQQQAGPPPVCQPVTGVRPDPAETATPCSTSSCPSGTGRTAPTPRASASAGFGMARLTGTAAAGIRTAAEGLSAINWARLPQLRDCQEARRVRTVARRAYGFHSSGTTTLHRHECHRTSNCRPPKRNRPLPSRDQGVDRRRARAVT